jgi:hypothetical protein
MRSSFKGLSPASEDILAWHLATLESSDEESTS